jgi:hypothetical protein
LVVQVLALGSLKQEARERRLRPHSVGDRSSSHLSFDRLAIDDASVVDEPHASQAQLHRVLVRRRRRRRHRRRMPPTLHAHRRSLSTLWLCPWL